MAYFGTIPEAPDIRQQRPGYFNQPVDFPRGFAMPEGTQEFDPMANQWQTEVPDLWPEIEQELRGIMQRSSQPYYMTPEGGELTPEQIEHNKMLMAWKSPSGLSAIETGKYRELQQREAQLDRAEKRVANIEKQILAASKIDGLPKGIAAQLEKRLNSAVSAYDTMLKKQGQPESGFPKYTGEGKFKLAGLEKQPGIIDRAKAWFGGDDSGILEGQESPLGPTPGVEEMEPGAGGPVAAVADITQQAGGVFLKALLKLDTILAESLGNEKAKEVTDKIVRDNPPVEGEGVPIARIEQAIAALPPKVRKSEAVQQMQRQITARKLQKPGATRMEPKLPVLERFQRGLPTNEEYIQGGGLPGMVGRAVTGRPLVKRGE